MKRFILCALVVAFITTATIGVIDYTNFRRLGCRVDYSDPLELSDGTYYYGTILTGRGLEQCWKHEDEWDAIKHWRYRHGY